MHSAAEKARLRRLGEETEREAAAERARRKARDLEERLGLRSATLETKVKELREVSLASATPPGLFMPVTAPQVTLAPRPKPTMDVLQPVTSPIKTTSTFAGLPPRPTVDARVGEISWRTRTMADEAAIREATRIKPLEQAQGSSSNERPARPSSEPFVELPTVVIQPLRDSLRKTEPVCEDPPHVAPASTNPVGQVPPVAESAATLPADTEQSLLPKKESNFDQMLARIQAAMAEARVQVAPLSPSPAVMPTSANNTAKPSQLDAPKDSSPGSSQPRPVVMTSATVPRPQGPRPDFTSTAIVVVPEYFDVTQPLPAKSLPPAWRTFTVKLPKSTTSRSPMSKRRFDASESSFQSPPKGWLMSFEPPIEQLPPLTMSRAELLLPQPVQRRFGKHVDMGPLVSISPRRLEMFQKKGKKKLIEIPRPDEVVVPTTAGESLLASSISVESAGMAEPPVERRQPIHTRGDSRWKAEASMQSSVPADVAKRPSPSPVKTSQAAKKQKDGLFKADGIAIGPPGRGRMPIDLKPGVRFMVSSELEGDSLLDEVNKMSLEAVGEGEDKGDDGTREGETKAPGTEVRRKQLKTSCLFAYMEQTPKTPPSVGGTSSRGNPSSPNGVSTPWTRSSRSSSQHDHLKSVWEQTLDPAPEPARSIEAFPPQAPTSQGSEAFTLLYPSLNAPSPADPPAQQLLPSSNKMGYSTGQTYSSPGGAPPTTSFRQSSGHGYGYNGYTSPDPGQSPMGLSYASLGTARPNGASANGFPTVQQGVWSSSAFGTGYGYGAKPAQGVSSMDQKAAMAFNTAPPVKDQPQTYHAAFAQRPQSPQGYPPTLSPHGYNPTSPYGPPPAQIPAQYGRGATNPQPNGMFYQYGAPGPTQMSGRTYSGQQAREYPTGAGGYGESGGYYGGAAGQQALTQGLYQNFGGHGAIGQQGRTGATTGVGQGQGASKMW